MPKTTNDKKTFTKDEAKDLIEKSGNNFHCKVVSFFKENGWRVLVSPYYNDNFSEKPREIDIIAEKDFPIDYYFQKNIGKTRIQLFIECKFIKEEQGAVFWFFEKDETKTKKMIHSRLSNYCKSASDIDIKKFHYFLDKKAAKLFYSGKENNDNDHIFKAINQSLNSLIYYRKNKFALDQERICTGLPIFIFHYPLVIFNKFDNFYKEEDESRIEEIFQLEVNYAYFDENKKGINEYFLIDFLSFEKIKKFLETLEGDIQILTQQILPNEIIRQKETNRQIKKMPLPNYS